MIQLEDITKAYRGRGAEVRALDGVTLKIDGGEFVTFKGPSGSGKTTLLMLLGGMQHPSAGRVIVNGKDLYAMGAAERSRFRANQIGFVFQMFHLVPYINVLDNVLLAPAAGPNGARRDAARALLERLGRGERAAHKPAELSAGEKQRVALARASINRPKLILADEPTGNLDPKNAAAVMAYLAEFYREGGTVVTVTHGDAADGHANRILQLRAGQLVSAE